jgi:flagellar biosynthesis/type III secretory pathway protein FliH
MTQMKKFLFDTPFTPDGRILEQSPQTRCIYTLEDMEAACAQARQDALATAREEMGTNATRQKAQALASLGASMRHALAQIDEAMTVLHKDAAELALVAASAIAARALEGHGRLNATHVIESVLEDLKTAPQVRLRVNEHLMAAIREELTVFAAELGADDRIQIIPDPSLQPGDIRLDFPGGGVALRRADVIAKIQAIFADHLQMENANS